MRREEVAARVVVVPLLCMSTWGAKLTCSAPTRIRKVREQVAKQ